ncbi:MAG: lipopolysaccharide biosynthesis protein [Chloroflexi bacterium]|nr:lipopolysaccharide biosynthesis protein [Chloroflexota bacterium]
MPLWPPRALFDALVRRKLARDVAFLQASNTLQKGYGFVFSVAAARMLGLTGYGEFLLILSLYTTVNLLGSLGLGQFLVVPLAKAAAADDREEIALACGYNLKMSAIVAAAVLAFALAAGPWVGAFMHRPDLGELMRIVAFGGVAAVAYTFSTTALQSVRRMRDLALVENVDAVLGRALGLAAALAGWGLAGLLWGMVFGGLLSAAHAFYQYRRVAVRQHGFPDLGTLAAAAWRVPVRRYFRFSMLAVVDKNVAQFFGQTPLLFLGRWAGPEEAAYFGIAAKVFTLLAAFHGAVSKALSVRLSQELSRRGVAATQRLFWQSSLLWGAVSTVAAAGFITLLPLYRWIYGPEYLPSLLLVVLFGALTAKQGFTVSLGSIFLIMDRVATNAIAKLPLMAVAMPVGALMVQRWGAAGAVGYQLGAFALGDVVYFGILATPWFWRRKP